MPAGAPDAGGAAPSPGYRRLAVATAVVTFLLIVLGGVVRVSDSGLGCGPAGSGLDGWPLCDGDVIPGLELNTVIEFAHRLTAVTVGFMVLALAVLAWRRYRAHRSLVAAAGAATVLVGVEGALGRFVVEENLDERLVAAHLGIAMVILALLLYLARASRPEVIGKPGADGGPRLRRLAAAAATVIFLAIVAGGYMAGTQNYGRADYQLGDGAHHACGKEFPTCNGDFLPFGQARLVDIHLTHRVLVYLGTLLVLWLAVAALRRRPGPGVVRGARLALALLLAQLLVGALNVWLDEYEALIALHLALGTLLWASVIGIGIQLYRVPAPVTATAPDPSPAPPRALTT